MIRISKKNSNLAALVGGPILALLGLLLAASAGLNPHPTPSHHWWELPGVLQLFSYALYFGGGMAFLGTIREMAEEKQ